MSEGICTEKTYLGIELGSTRIKACLTDDTFMPIADGYYEWENKYENGFWTYAAEDIHRGVKACVARLKEDVLKKHGVRLSRVGAIGVSAMMHGYLAFDQEGQLLAPFRTWRNTTTQEAADTLTELFGFHIPQRWSIAHLYQAILNGEEHVSEIAHITTLAGYIHFRLTGKWELGIGDASGMFPISGNDYDEAMLAQFDNLIGDKKLPWKLRDILPKVKRAGEKGAFLTKQGASFLEDALCEGIPVCPPEGDAGTGMVATNSVRPKTGNVSAGTSIFSMLVLEKPLKKLYRSVDVVTTPDGLPVAMVHCNNCCGELDAWVNMFDEFSKLAGFEISKSKLYEMLYRNALTGDSSGIVSYNYISGEHTTDIKEGRPMYFRLPESKMKLAGFMKSQLFSAVASLAIGMESLFDAENVRADKFYAHGGLFKVEGVAQQILASALKTPVSVMKTAGEGGAWGMALLAAYMIQGNGQGLGEWLGRSVFCHMQESTLSAEREQTEAFTQFICHYKQGLMAERILGEV